MDEYRTVPRDALRQNLRRLSRRTGATILWKKSSERRNPVLEFAASTAAGLAAIPRRLECRFLYDAAGSRLFEKITRQPEYYLTRVESAILAANAFRIRNLTGPVTLAELGSGNSAKTEFLLQAWLKQGASACYIPVDVSESALLQACRSITSNHPSLRVIGVHAHYEESFPLFQEISPLLLIFLGSSIGNFTPEETSLFLNSLSRALLPGDFFLLGVDLVKDPKLLHAAYNDKAGVTAAFTRNIFARMNRELSSRIDLSAVEHAARYDPEKEQVQIGARFRRHQQIKIAPLGKSFLICGGEHVEVEISRKFRLESFLPEVERFGFLTEEIFTDNEEFFALILLRRSGSSPDTPAGRPR